jgi:hypothetical protein
MSELDREIADATEWISCQLGRVQFGDVGVKLVIHAGRVVRVEKTVTEKEQPVEHQSDGGAA